MKRILALILVLASIFTIVACDGGKKESGKGDGNVLSLVDKDGKVRFTIPNRSENGTTAYSLISMISKELRAKVGGIFRVENYKGEAENDPDAYELLIGDTGKKETIELAEGLGASEYRIKVMGRKIVVVGGNELAVSKGVSILLSSIDYEKKCVPADLDLSGSFSDGKELLVGMANQTKKCVEVYDISSGLMNSESLVWSYPTTCSTISGFKFREHPTYGKVVLIVGGDVAEMVSYDTKEVLWRTTNSSPNGHSLDLLPNGIIITGGTVGNDIHFYNLNSDKPTKIIHEIPFPDAHGVLWDPKYEVVWVAGSDKLTAFKVTLNDDGTVTVVKDEDLSFVTPESGLHDLQPYFGNEDWLLISTSNHVYIYDKVNKTVTDAYEGVLGATTDHVKGVGRFENGDMFYMFYDGGNDNGQGGGWNTTYLTYILEGAKIVGTVPSDRGRFYKCRVWYSDYQ